MNKFNTKYPIKKISDNEYRIESNAKQGMNVPVTIYANEALLEKMLSDRTIDQAVNVTHLPGIYKHAIVLPDGHEGYGFPIGGVAATDAETGVISPGGVGYDINCGVRILQTNLTEKDVKPKLQACAKQPPERRLPFTFSSPFSLVSLAPSTFLSEITPFVLLKDLLLSLR